MAVHTMRPSSASGSRERLTKNVVFRVTPRTHAAYRAAAASRGLGLADWIRGHLPVQAPSTGRSTPGTASPRRAHARADPELLRQLAALGNNLNQLARRVNAAPHPERLPILQRVVAIERELTAIRRRHGC